MFEISQIFHNNNVLNFLRQINVLNPNYIFMFCSGRDCWVAHAELYIVHCTLYIVHCSHLIPFPNTYDRFSKMFFPHFGLQPL